MRKGLPGGEVGDDIGVEHAAEGGREVLGLAAGRRDDEQRQPVGRGRTEPLHRSCDEGGARTGSDGDVERHRATCGGGLEEGVDLGCRAEMVDDGLQRGHRPPA